MVSRNERYKRDFERANRDRLHYRAVAVRAVAELLRATGDHAGLLDGDDLADAQRVAAQLRGTRRMRRARRDRMPDRTG